MTQDQWNRQVQEQLHRVDTRSGVVAAALSDFLRVQQAELRRTDVRAVTEHLDRLTMRHHQYSQLMTVIGYGGFLTLWGSTHERLPPLAFAAAGACMAVSLLVFVIAELTFMDMLNTAYRDVREVQGSPQDKLDFLDKRSTEFNGRWHRRFFWWTTGPGILGAAILCLSLLYVVARPDT